MFKACVSVHRGALPLPDKSPPSDMGTPPPDIPLDIGGYPHIPLDIGGPTRHIPLCLVKKGAPYSRHRGPSSGHKVPHQYNPPPTTSGGFIRNYGLWVVHLLWTQEDLFTLLSVVCFRLHITLPSGVAHSNLNTILLHDRRIIKTS